MIIIIIIIVIKIVRHLDASKLKRFLKIKFKNNKNDSLSTGNPMKPIFITFRRHYDEVLIVVIVTIYIYLLF